MDYSRYPIGSFEPIPNPTSAQRSEWIAEIAGMPGLLRQTLQHFTPEQLLTLYRPGGWTVQQVVHHMADNDMNAYIRFKRALTEPSPAAGSFREDEWARLADYSAPIEPSLLLLEALHRRFVVLLRSLQPVDFQKTFTSPTHGVLSLDVAMQRYAWHNRHHIAQIASLRERMGWP